MRSHRVMSAVKGGLTGCLVISLILAGCAGNRELLEVPLPQSYFLPSPPARVWRAIVLVASKPARRILVHDEAARLLSWIDAVEPNEQIHVSLTDTEVAEGEAMEIAVARVEDAPGGTRLIINVTYLSREPLVGVSSSRGNYERQILRTIRESLISEAAGHARNR